MAITIVGDDEGREQPLEDSGTKSRFPAGFSRVGSDPNLESDGDDEDSDGAGEQVRRADGAVDPASISATRDNNSGGNTPGKRGRGRPRKSGDSNQRKPSTTKTTNSLARILVGIHSMGAQMLAPQLEISQDEANELSKAIQEVTELYDVPLPSAEIMAWVGLGGCLTKIYGPRIGSIILDKKTAKAKQPRSVQNTPTPIRTAAPNVVRPAASPAGPMYDIATAAAGVAE